MNSNNVYKWIAGALLAVVLGYGGNAIASTINLRERVTKLETAFQYVVDKINHLDSHYHDNE